MDPRNPNRRVQFPEAGEGAYLLLRNSGCRDLQNQIGLDWFMAIEKGLHFYNVDLIEKMLAVMVWKDDAKLKVSLDDLGEDVLMETVSSKLMDGFSLAIHGRTYKEQIAWIEVEQKRLMDEVAASENPPTSPPISSTELSSKPTGQASDQPSSTL